MHAQETDAAQCIMLHRRSIEAAPIVAHGQPQFGTGTAQVKLGVLRRRMPRYIG